MIANGKLVYRMGAEGDTDRIWSGLIDKLRILGLGEHVEPWQGGDRAGGDGAHIVSAWAYRLRLVEIEMLTEIRPDLKPAMGTVMAGIYPWMAVGGELQAAFGTAYQLGGVEAAKLVLWGAFPELARCFESSIGWAFDHG